MKKLLAMSLICAAFASMAKAEISDETFRLAGQWSATEQCAIHGRISAESAAFGKQILRDSLEGLEIDKAQFNILLSVIAGKEYAKKIQKGPDPKICNQIAMQIEDIRLQRSTAEAKAQAQARGQAQAQSQAQAEAQARAQLEQQQLREAQARAQLEQQQRREAQMAAQQQQQEREADAAYKRREMEAMTQQLNQIGQQFRDFGNSVQPRTTNCTRTLLGANCTSY